MCLKNTTCACQKMRTENMMIPGISYASCQCKVTDLIAEGVTNKVKKGNRERHLLGRAIAPGRL